MRVISNVENCFEIQNHPHPDPLTEYLERGQEQHAFALGASSPWFGLGSPGRGTARLSCAII